MHDPFLLSIYVAYPQFGEMTSWLENSLKRGQKSRIQLPVMPFRFFNTTSSMGIVPPLDAFSRCSRMRSCPLEEDFFIGSSSVVYWRPMRTSAPYSNEPLSLKEVILTEVSYPVRLKEEMPMTGTCRSRLKSFNARIFWSAFILSVFRGLLGGII